MCPPPGLNKVESSDVYNACGDHLKPQGIDHGINSLLVGINERVSVLGRVFVLVDWEALELAAQACKNTEPELELSPVKPDIDVNTVMETIAEVPLLPALAELSTAVADFPAETKGQVVDRPTEKKGQVVDRRDVSDENDVDDERAELLSKLSEKDKKMALAITSFLRQGITEGFAGAGCG